MTARWALALALGLQRISAQESEDWRVVPPLAFSRDGLPEEAVMFEDNGLRGGRLPQPGEEWQGFISEELADRVDPTQFFTTVDSLDNLVRRAENNELIVLVSGISYKDVLLNFIWILEKRFGIFHYGIACMDDAMCEWLESVGKRDMAYRMDEARLVLAYQLLQAGVSLVLTDTDAVWIRNPLPHLRSADITAQRDRHPRELFLEWGSTFCTGLLGLRAKPMVVKFFAAFITMLNPKSKFLDQRTFNHAIQNAGIDWFGKQLVHGFGESKTIDLGALRRFGNLSVALLPQDPYRRLCSSKQGSEMQMKSAVLHCTGARKEGGSKRDSLESFHLWVLPDDWEAKLDRSVGTSRRMFNDEPWTDLVERIRNGELRSAPNGNVGGVGAVQSPRGPGYVAGSSSVGAPASMSQPLPSGAGGGGTVQAASAAIAGSVAATATSERGPAPTGAGGNVGAGEEGAAYEAYLDPSDDPQYWRMATADQFGGRTYWYNEATLETSWTRPDCVAHG